MIISTAEARKKGSCLFTDTDYHPLMALHIKDNKRTSTWYSSM